MPFLTKTYNTEGVHDTDDKFGGTTMNRVLKTVAVAIFSMCVVSWQLQAGVVNITQGSTSGYTMTDGNTYVIQNSVSFSNSTAGGSGMSVADNATVVLYVPAGVTLTARGANGSGRTGGGAGIRVPQTATFIITGEGTVNAFGGNAGNGGKGENGGDGSNDIENGMVFGGAGGTGGAGGGGAGTGIGGCGGIGGIGGVGEIRHETDYAMNNNGGTLGANIGGDGGNGESMGIVYVLGIINIVATNGEEGVPGGKGDAGLTARGGGRRLGGGGGGGGGGAGASPSFSIGGGGSAGGGGASGAQGLYDGNDNPYNKNKQSYNVTGRGGCGGRSAASPGGSANNSYKNGGAAGVEGGAGVLYVSPMAIINVNREKLSASTHPAVPQYTITFDVNEGQFSSLVKSLTATLGCVLPDCIPTPTRRGYLFDGWRTAAGEEYFGASGAKSKSSYPVVGNVTLYAQWQVDETYVDHTVTTPEEVPYSFFDNDYPALLAEHGGDYEAAALATAANGHNKVWECFVAGISPTNESSRFSAKIEIVDGAPIVTWEPDLNTNGVVRTYKVYGSETLNNGGDWQYPTNSLHRFFKVTVEMP